MSKWEKLLNRIELLSSDLRFEELQKVLEYYGYTISNPRGGSSHFTFRKAGHYPITVPKNAPIKKIYIELVREMIEQEENNDENNDENNK